MDIFNMNGQTVSKLTIIKRIAKLRKARELVKMAKTAKTKGAGRPPELFSFEKKTAKPVVAVEQAPVVEAETPATAPVVETVPATPTAETVV
jgi:predicted ArsR family transcriptional regulator